MKNPSVQGMDGRKTGKPTYAAHRSVSLLRVGVKAPFARGRVLLPREITPRAVHRKVYGSAHDPFGKLEFIYENDFSFAQIISVYPHQVTQALSLEHNDVQTLHQRMNDD